MISNISHKRKMVMDRDNLVALLKGLGIGLINSFILYEFLTKVIIDAGTFENEMLLLPFILLSGIMMGIAQYGADEGLGYVSLFLFLGGYIAIAVVAIVASITYQNPMYLFTLGSISSVFMFWYIALENGNSNVWLISITGALIITISAILLEVLLASSAVFGIVLVAILTAINVGYVIYSRITKGSIVDV